MPRAFDSEYLRYLTGAVICAVLNNVILIGGDRLGYGYAELTVLTFLITGSLAYVLHSCFTFRRSKGWSKYLGFMAGLGLGVPVTLLFLAVLRSLLGLPMYVAAPAVTVLMFVYNFLNARFAITRRLFGEIAREGVRNA